MEITKIKEVAKSETTRRDFLSNSKLTELFDQMVY
jgi:hypothetical protein